MAKVNQACLGLGGGGNATEVDGKNTLSDYFLVSEGRKKNKQEKKKF